MCTATGMHSSAYSSGARRAGGGPRDARYLLLSRHSLRRHCRLFTLVRSGRQCFRPKPCQDFDSTTPAGFERLNGHAAADERMALPGNGCPST
jgi:hypothetical protein